MHKPFATLPTLDEMSGTTPTPERIRTSFPSSSAASQVDRLDVLYISLDGITDPLGRSQVIPYLVGLSKLGHRITLLTMEKPAAFAAEGAKVRKLLDDAGIRWVPVRYLQKPPIASRLWNVRSLRRRAFALQREAGFDLVHCRSYIPASIGLSLRRKFGVPFLFDMRGFFPDERKEGGSWPQSNPFFRLVYRHFKALETDLLKEAGGVISLTHQGRSELGRMTGGRLDANTVAVIPCCVDFTHFPLTTKAKRRNARKALGIGPEERVIAYLGSIGSWYMLDEMLDFFKVYRERFPDARFLFVTPQPPSAILPMAASKGLGQDAFVIRSASREEVPEFMAAADLGVFFIRPVYSKTASSPTKMAELIALGLPIVTNAGVGDVAELVEQTGCGVAIEDFTVEAYRDAIEAIERRSEDPAEVRRRAQPIFDVDLGVESYDACYRSIARERVS